MEVAGGDRRGHEETHGDLSEDDGNKPQVRLEGKTRERLGILKSLWFSSRLHPRKVRLGFRYSVVSIQSITF